jgi:hypothetical protein
MRSDESRISRGWRLTKAAWRTMRGDRTMIVLALIGTVCALAGTALMLDVGGVFSSGHHSRAQMGLAGLIFLYPITFVSVFFNVALTAAACAGLDGRRIGLAAALGEAWKRVGRIAGWALLASVVGFLLQQIVSRIPGAGRVVGWLMGAAWALCTIFAIPILVVEETGPVDAARGSAGLVRKRWGEGLTGIVGISAWTIVAMLPAGFLVGIGLALTAQETVSGGSGIGILLIAVGAIAIVLASAFANATRQVFNLALYRYATGLETPGFASSDLEEPFKRRRGRGD